MNEKQLYSYVLLFHNAIIEIKKQLSVEFNNFPAGSCGSTCVLLGTFLHENGFGNFKQIIGEKYIQHKGKELECSHSWLESENSLIIDITAYQFPEIEKKFIVQKSNSWYKQWKIIEIIDNVTIASYKNPTDIANYDMILTTIKSKIKKGLY